MAEAAASNWDLQDEIEEDFLKPRPPSNDDELDITPMIDITFLLLIFFLVSSKMTAEQVPDLPKARHGIAVSGKDAAVVIMKRGSGDQADVQKPDGTSFSSDLEQQNVEIAEYIQAEFDAGKKRVILKAEGPVRTGEVSRVSEAISQSLEEGEMINVAVMDQS